MATRSPQATATATATAFGYGYGYGYGGKLKEVKLVFGVNGYCYCVTVDDLNKTYIIIVEKFSCTYYVLI